MHPRLRSLKRMDHVWNAMRVGHAAPALVEGDEAQGHAPSVVNEVPGARAVAPELVRFATKAGRKKG